MSERLIPKQELAEKVFSKGMLVHGFDSVWLQNALKDGIKPTSILRNPLGVCFAMLSDYEDPWDRFHNTKHNGATNEFSQEVSILISPDDLMTKHPGRLVAIGWFFRSLARGGKAFDIGREFGFPVDTQSKTVHGVPIERPREYELSWDDEVRLYCADSTQTIPTSIWAGIVVAEKTLPELQRSAKNVGYDHPIPVFNPNLELVANDLSHTAGLS